MTSTRLRIQRKSLDMLSNDERESWIRLLSESATTCWAFLSPTYAEAVNATLGAVDVVLCWQGDELAGVMPLQRATGWLGRLGIWEPVGRQMTDYFGILALPKIQFEWHQLLRAAGVPCLYFTHLDESQAAHGLIGESPRKGLRTRIHPDGGTAHWEWLRMQDRKLIGDTERRERKLEREHGALVFHMNSPSPEKDLDALIDLKNAQYHRTGHETGALMDESNASLLRWLQKKNGNDCVPRVSTLRCGEKLIAAHFGLQSGGFLHYWFPAYDTTYANYSPGRILYKNVIVESHRYGINIIDRGEGDSEAKRDFASEEHFFKKGLYSVGACGMALKTLIRMKWRVSSGGL